MVDRNLHVIKPERQAGLSGLRLIKPASAAPVVAFLPLATLIGSNAD
jgi:hypothetical protein